MPALVLSRSLKIFPGDLDVPNGPKVRAYKPIEAQGSAVPLILFIHGGGWFAGNLDTEDRTARMVCSMVPAWVVSVDYICGFEATLHEKVDDCCKAFEWAYGRAADHGCDPSKMVIWGGSAGGALATALVYRLVQEGKGDQVAGLVSMNGLALHPDATPSEYKNLMTSYVENAGPLPFISGDDGMELYRFFNLGPPNTDFRLFPAAGGAKAVRGFPSTYIITSDNDAARDDGTVLEAVLRDAGVSVKRDNVMGLAHYFWIFPLPKVNEKFWNSLTKGIRWTLG